MTFLPAVTIAILHSLSLYLYESFSAPRPNARPSDADQLHWRLSELDQYLLACLACMLPNAWNRSTAPSLKYSEHWFVHFEITGFSETID
jgi:hypothetical protein